MKHPWTRPAAGQTGLLTLADRWLDPWRPQISVISYVALYYLRVIVHSTCSLLPFQWICDLMSFAHGSINSSAIVCSGFLALAISNDTWKDASTEARFRCWNTSTVSVQDCFTQFAFRLKNDKSLQSACFVSKWLLSFDGFMDSAEITFMHSTHCFFSAIRDDADKSILEKLFWIASLFCHNIVNLTNSTYYTMSSLNQWFLNFFLVRTPLKSPCSSRTPL